MGKGGQLFIGQLRKGSQGYPITGAQILGPREQLGVGHRLGKKANLSILLPEPSAVFHAGNRTRAQEGQQLLHLRRRFAPHRVNRNSFASQYLEHFLRFGMEAAIGLQEGAVQVHDDNCPFHGSKIPGKSSTA
jgi:hypothetical protein